MDVAWLAVICLCLLYFVIPDREAKADCERCGLPVDGERHRHW